MKKLSLFLIFLFLVSAIAYANELTGSALEIQEKPSSTPGKFTWGIQRFLEKIKLAATFGAEKKAAYGLQIAEKRLAEIQELAKNNDTENIEKAKQEYEQQIEQIKEQLEKLKDTNSEQELKKLAFFEGKLLRFEDKIQRLQSFVDTKTNLTEDQQEKLNDIIEKLKEKDEEINEKLSEKENKTKEKLNLTEEELDQKLEQIKEEFNITQLKQELVQRNIERLQNKEEKLREIATNQQEKGKNTSILLTRLDTVNANLQQITSSNLSIQDQKELIKETQKLLNFKQVYRSNDVKDINEVKEKIKEKIREKKPQTGIANPASVYCEENDGKLEIRETTSGQVGYCKFSDGSEWEEWAYYKGECKPQEITTNEETENKTI